MKLDADALSFERVESWFGRVDAIAADGQVDLADVSQVDSAGVALLLEAARRARRQGKSLAFVNAPPQLCGLLKFFGVDAILGINTA